jgi:hypothetical protein
MEKRCKVVSGQKTRPNYVYFAKILKKLRKQGEPMTPDPEKAKSKRQLESWMFEWREGLRCWHAFHGCQGGDTCSHSEQP